MLSSSALLISTNFPLAWPCFSPVTGVLPPPIRCGPHEAAEPVLRPRSNPCRRVPAPVSLSAHFSPGPSDELPPSARPSPPQSFPPMIETFPSSGLTSFLRAIIYFLYFLFTDIAFDSLADNRITFTLYKYTKLHLEKN